LRNIGIQQRKEPRYGQPQSQRIRATFANDQKPPAAALEAQRQEWEAAVAATNLQLAAVIMPDLAQLD